MARVLLVGPDFEENLSIRYLASALGAGGHRATLAAFNAAADLPAVVRAARGCDVVGLSLTFQVRAREFLALAAALKDAGVRTVVAGGHYATCEAEALLTHHPSLDVIVLHEGERAIVEIADRGADRHALREVAGLVFRDDGGLHHTQPRRSVDDLDALPFPIREGPVHTFAGVPTAFLMGSRGCVANCDYCCIVTLHRLAPGKKFRQRDPEHVADEMAELFRRRGIRQFVFHDDNFLVPSVDHNHRRLDAYERAWAVRGLDDIGFTIKCRPPDAERSVFARLKKMGLIRVFLGIESSSEDGLCAIGRRQTVEQSERALELCAELGISAQYTMMMFNPDATLETVRSDLAFLRRHDDHALNFCRTEIYAGTPLEARMIAEGRARGSYLARTYDIADPAVDLACRHALSLFARRCWSDGGATERAIGLDHLAAVVRHFYDGDEARALVAASRAWRRAVNRNLVDLLDDLVASCAVASGPDDPALAAAVDDVRRREAASSRALLADYQHLRERMDSLVRRGAGSGRPAWGAADGLARHAAAVLLALAAGGGLVAHGGCGEMAPPPLEDSDGDGLPDRCELTIFGTSPHESDTDGDSVRDGGSSWSDCTPSSTSLA